MAEGIEAAGNNLAELVKQGNRVWEAYAFNEGQLVSGFPEWLLRDQTQRHH
jgi:hypothetical protein